MSPPRRKLLIIAVVLAACAFAGGAYAASRDSGAATRQAFLNDVAQRLGVTPQKLTAAFEGALTDQLNAAVKAGKLTQAQANAIEQRSRAHGFLPFGMLGPGPIGIGPGPFGPGPGPLGPGPRRLHFRVVRPGALLSAAAKYLGISTTELRSELRQGKSLRQIATEHGKTAAGLRQALRAAMPRIEAPYMWRFRSRPGVPAPGSAPQLTPPASS